MVNGLITMLLWYHHINREELIELVQQLIEDISGRNSNLMFLNTSIKHSYFVVHKSSHMDGLDFMSKYAKVLIAIDADNHQTLLTYLLFCLRNKIALCSNLSKTNTAP